VGDVFRRLESTHGAGFARRLLASLSELLASLRKLTGAIWVCVAQETEDSAVTAEGEAEEEESFVEDAEAAAEAAAMAAARDEEEEEEAAQSEVLEAGSEVRGRT
jgi:hypothetical protein